MKLLTLMLLASLPAAAVAQEPPFISRAEYLALAGNISGDAAFEHMRVTTRWHKPRGSTPGLMEVARYVEARAREYGVEDVRLIRQPSTTPGWFARSAELWIDGATTAGQPRWERVVSLQQHALHLADNSRSATVTAQIVDLGSGIDSAQYASTDVRGKLVLAWGPIATVAALAVRRFGAAGVINRPDPTSVQALDYPDQIRWSTSPADAFAFVLSHRQGVALSQRLATGPRMARASVDAVTDSTERWQVMVEGLVRGTDPTAKAIVLTGHMQEGMPSANDDASGVSSVLEIARTMTALIRTGEIPRPRRTIRFWWVTEIGSERQYFADHPDEAGRLWLNINQDMVGANQGLDVLRVQNITRLPWARAHFLEDVAAAVINWLVDINGQQLAQAQVPAGSIPWRAAPIIAHLGTRHRYNAALVPFHNNTDHMTFNEAPIGVPGITFTNWPDNYIHTSEDDLWNVDRTQLERNAIAVAMMTLYLARAGDDQVPELVGAALGGAMRRIGLAHGMAASWVLTSPADNRAATLRAARLQVEVATDLAMRQMRTVQDVAGNDVSRRLIARAVTQIEANGRARLADLDQLWRDMTGQALPAAPAPDSIERRLTAMRPALATGPTRFLDGRGAIANVPGLHSLMAHEIASAVDGQRTGLDIYRLVVAEARAGGVAYYGNVTSAMVLRYLENMAAVGLVRL